MNDINNDGGPAFPGKIHTTIGGTIDGGGMSLLDYFAGQALAGILANPTIKVDITEENNAALCAYRFAEAMLKGRERFAP